MNESERLDTLPIHDLLCRFMQSFDDKDWQHMRACLHDTVWCDYSSFRDAPPAAIPAERYVAQRQAALSALVLQHNFTNLRVEVQGDRASARCNYIIHRFHPQFSGAADGFFHSYGHYELTLRRLDEVWKIDGIAQHLLMNHGNPELHGATRSTDNTRQV